MQRLVHGYGGRGEFEPAIAYTRRWLALDPLCEPAHLHLMLLYARSGQRIAALRRYGECERVLKEELGLPKMKPAPGPEEAAKNRSASVRSQGRGIEQALDLLDRTGALGHWPLGGHYSQQRAWGSDR